MVISGADLEQRFQADSKQRLRTDHKYEAFPSLYILTIYLINISSS